MLFSRHRLVVLAACMGLVCAAGCGPGGLRGAREERDLLLKRARALKNAQDIPGAVEAYQRALDNRPKLARAHLELGWIYDHDLEDYVRAIHHYQRYLELRPDVEDEERELVTKLIQHARLSYAASLPDKPSEAIRVIAMLKEENAALRAQLDARAAPRAAAPAVPPAPAPPSAPAAAAAPPIPAPPAQVPLSAMTPYVVQPGDTLSRIAGRVYGDSKKWQPIYDANRSALPGGPQSVKVGQTLMVPKLENR